MNNQQAVPSKYFADACDEAARAFDSRIAEIDAARTNTAQTIQKMEKSNDL